MLEKCVGVIYRVVYRLGAIMLHPISMFDLSKLPAV